MKQFSLGEYLKDPSRKVVTRDGRPVRIICTDAMCKYPIVALITEDNALEILENYTNDGLSHSWGQTPNDLFFAHKKYEGWVNVIRNSVYNEAYCGRIYDSYEEAKSHANNATLATAKIEWEK